MKTIPTLCATSTGIGVSALGFVLARPDRDTRHERQHPNNQPSPHSNRPSDSHRNHSQSLHPHSLPKTLPDPGVLRPPSTARAPPSALSTSDMTSTATCTVQTVDTYATPTSFCAPFGFSARQSLRSQSGPPPRNAPGHARTFLKKREALTMPHGLNLPPPPQDGPEASPPISPTFASHQTPSWLKRFSFSSSTQYSGSRPNSSIISDAPSASSSTTPIVTGHSLPINTAPNKLVKRSTSVSKIPTSASFGGSTTKIPIPTLRRPATSHKRSATLQERRTNSIPKPKAENAFRRSLYDSIPESAPDVQWCSYFGPISTADPLPAASTRRRGSSTSIPNPIKRVYADRKYRPVLVSARENVKAAPIVFDTDAGDDLEPVPGLKVVSSASVDGFYSSPDSMPVPVSNGISPATVDFQSTSFDSRLDGSDSAKDQSDEQDDAPELSRIESATSSFSVSDILPAEPQVWKEPPPIKAAPLTKYRRPAARARSNTPTSMGVWQSLPEDASEKLAKYRDAVDSTQAAELPSVSSPVTEIDLRLSSHETKSTSTALPKAGRPTNPQGDDLVSFNTLPSAARIRQQSAPTIGSPSYLAGSDSDARSGGDDDDEHESHSDTIYDSVRTKAPKSSPGRRGPSIETIFGDSPPFHIHGKHTMLRDYLQTHDNAYSRKPRHSIIHEEDALSTPKRSSRNQSLASSPLLRAKQSPVQTSLASSPPTMPSLSDIRHHAERFPNADEDDDDGEESTWSFTGDNDDEEPQFPLKSRFAHLGITPDLMSPQGHASSSANTTPQRPSVRSTDRDTRSSIFDWSEQQPIEKSPNSRSPPRPKTVHGKKDAETRGSRSVGRRAPSGLHTRSQSVPTAQDADGKRSGTNKFGTWGIGSKGVTEDWNEDFDFEDESAVEEKRLDSGVVMFVPQKIQDQQTKVLANIGLLRDWGLLIEELKEHKMRAVTLGVLEGGNEMMWGEVDAMIDLADQESDEQTLAPRYSPSSSPSINYDEFDEPLPTLPSTDYLMPSPLFGLPESPAGEEFDFFNEAGNTSSSRTENGILVIAATSRRPRKNSEAVALSVIEALQQKRLSGSGLVPEGRDKVHFDTATLKRIIPYVQELRDRVKKVIRDAEDLLPSPKSLRGSIGSHGSRSVRRRIREASDSPTMRRRSHRFEQAVERVPSDEGIHSPTEELNASLRLMAMT